MFIESKKARWVIIFFAIVLAVYIVLPNFYPTTGIFAGKKKINYGLDIQGGIYLVMKANVEEALQARMQKKISILKADFKDEEFKFNSIDFKKNSTKKILITFNSNKTEIKTYLNKTHQDLQLLSETNNSLQLAYYEASLSLYKKEVINQSIEVIRNRIDAFGVSEPQIIAQGSKRILIQLPGVENADQAKELIHRTATLHFRPVYEDITLDVLQKWVSETEKTNYFTLGTEKSIRLAKQNNEKIKKLKYRQYIKKMNLSLKSKLPKNTKLIFQKSENAKTLEAGRVPFLIKIDNDLNGSYLENASVGSDEYGKPQVNFRFNVQGQKRFAKITAANIQKRVAIVLDDLVQSAPVIQEEINSPTARISLGSGDIQETLKEANFLATALRAGSLPVPLEQLEERSVGPSLGADSIAKGKRAGLIGALLVLIFMLVYYKGLGLLANVALSLNLLFIIAILTSLQATLTLPGVAGIILTIGMAVDANIIIFERIKEELSKGSSFRSAVRNGFSQAFAAIFDANITTAAVCIVLMSFGTGPVRGFAVTLISGIVTSLFTSVFISRSILELKIFNSSKKA